eukprot:1226522-Amphidinium_carterae.1
MDEEFGALAEELQVTLHRTDDAIRIFGFRQQVIEAMRRLHTWSGHAGSSRPGRDTNTVKPLKRRHPRSLCQDFGGI